MSDLPEPTYAAFSFQPYFGIGRYGHVRTQRDLEQQGLLPSGYHFCQGTYIWQPTEEWHISKIGNFLYESDALARPNRKSDDVDAIQPSRRLFVLGGSVAYGSSASGPDTTWHCMVERRLESLGPDRAPVVFNCALGGYVSLQEFLALVLVVSPRRPAGVIFLNGYNDLTYWLDGSRPGDPSCTIAFMKRWYDRPFTWGVDDPRRQLALEAHFLAVLADNDKRLTMARSIANVYCEAMGGAIALCRSIGAKVLVAFQPWRQKTRRIVGLDDSKWDLAPPLAAAFEETFDIIRERMLTTHPDAFADLTEIMDREDQVAWYTDQVHLDDRGQELLGVSIAQLLEERWYANITTAGA